jgi:hypothetical protein
MFRPENTLLNAQLTSSSASWGANLPQPIIYGEPVLGYSAINAATDISGKLIFYAITTLDSTYVFDRANKLNAKWPGSSKEISIVPIDAGVRYHIIAGGKIKSYNLAKNEIIDEVAFSTPELVLSVGNNNLKETVQAVRIFKDGTGCIEGYNAYFIQANANGGSSRQITRVRCLKAKHGEDFSENDNVTIYTYDISALAYGFNYYIAEMDLSDDGTKLAFADLNKVWVVNIDGAGDIDLNTSYSTDYSEMNYSLAVGGLEFVGNNKLIYSIFNAMEEEDDEKDEIRLWDFIEDDTYVFDESYSYARSNIEKTTDGHYVAAAEDGIYQLDPDELTISSYLTGDTLYKNIDRFQHYRTTEGYSYFGIYNLPDQIDGQTNEYLDYDEVVFNLSVNIGSGGTQTWTNTSHPLTTKGSGRVLVMNAISLTGSSVPIIMEDMEILFYTDAVMLASSANRITFRGCMLQAMSCGDMWRGIQVAHSTRTTPEGYMRLENHIPTDNYTRIQDAYRGLLYQGRNTTLEITGAHFAKNEKDLVIIGHIGNKVTIRNSYFTSLPLRDQMRGSSEGHSDGKKRTINNIEIISSIVNIGHTAPGQNNVISAGQTGILSHESKLTLQYTEIHSAKKYGIDFNSNWKSHPELDIRNCHIHDLFRGVVVYWGTSKSTFLSNSFSNTSGYAIEYKDNPGGELQIGDANNAALGNTFNNCNWQAIGCFNNNKFGVSQNTKIQISNNIFNNHSYAGAIFVGEAASPNRSYEILNITRNKVGVTEALGKGIIINSVTGANSDLPDMGEKRFFEDKFRADSNEIRFSDPTKEGIRLVNTKWYNVLRNDVHSGTWGDWRPSGLSMAEGRGNLVWGNTLQGGSGGKITGDNLFSNLYCNVLNQCVSGWQFEMSQIRTWYNGQTSINQYGYDYVIHGLARSGNDTDARPNSYLPLLDPLNPDPFHISWGADITLYTQDVDRHKWDLVQNKKIPRISYPFGKWTGGSSSIVHKTNRKNPCENYIGPDSIYTNPPNNFSAYGYIDTLLNWKILHHDIQIAHDTLKQSMNASIAALVEIENKLQMHEYHHADSLLAHFIPGNTWEEEISQVYRIWTTLNLSMDTIVHGYDQIIFTDTIWLSETTYDIDSFTLNSTWKSVSRSHLSDSLKDILVVIASKSPLYESPAAYSARVLLFALEEMDFQDSLPQFYPSIAGWVDSSCNWSNFPIRLDLFTSTGDTTGIFTYADEDGYFRFDGVDLQQLDTSVQYYTGAYLDNDVLFISEENKWKQLAFNGPMLFTCSSGYPNKSRLLEPNNARLQIFPNPTNGLITVSGLRGNWTLQVSDITGKKVLNIQGSGASTVCDLGSFKPGVYFIYTHENHNQSNNVHKIILQ